MTRKILAGGLLWFLCVAAIVPVAATGAQEAAKGITIGWLGYPIEASESNVLPYEQFKKNADKYGWKIVTATSAGDYTQIANGISNFVQSKINLMLVVYLDISKLTAELKQLQDAGIPIVGIDSGDLPGLLADIKPDNYKMGETLANYVVKYLGGKGNVAMFDLTTMQGIIDRNDAAKKVFKSAPGIKILDIQLAEGEDWANRTVAITEDWITKYGDQLDVLWGGWDGNGWYAAPVITSAGYSRDNIAVVGIDGVEKTLQMIREGTPYLATVKQDFAGYGEKAFEIAYDYIVNNKKPAQKIIRVDAQLITPENVPPAKE